MIILEIFVMVPRLVDACFHQRTNISISVHQQLLHPLVLQQVVEFFNLALRTVAAAEAAIPPLLLQDLHLPPPSLLDPLLLRSVVVLREEDIIRVLRINICRHLSCLLQAHLTLSLNSIWLLVPQVLVR